MSNFSHYTNKRVLSNGDYWNQRNHKITTQMQRRIYGHATDVEIRPLNEEKAVQAAVDLIGEFFVFSVSNNVRAMSLQSFFKLYCFFSLYV